MNQIEAEVRARLLRDIAEAERAGQWARRNHLARRLMQVAALPLDGTNPDDSAELRRAQMWAGMSRRGGHERSRAR